MRIELGLGLGLAINAMSYPVEKSNTGEANQLQELDQ
jgi:hypothetical protein